MQDIDQGAKAPCCCGKVQSSKDSSTNPQYREEQESLDTSRPRAPAPSDYLALSKDEKSFDALPIRRFSSSDSVTTYEAGCSGFIRKFSSYEHLRPTDRFVGNYNRAKVTELNDEEDEVVDEINEPVFVDIPTLVAVLIKPDDSLQGSSTQIEEICSDEVQEDSIDVDFIEAGNDEFDGSDKTDDVDLDNSSVNCCNALDDSGIGEFPQAPPSPASVERGRSKGKFSKQNSVDLSSSNLNVLKKFGSNEGISKKKEPVLQRSHTNLEKRSTLPDRVKKLNNIREIDDRKAGVRSASIWKAIGHVGSKDQLQRKSSNDSDKSLKDSASGKSGCSNSSSNNLGRKPSLESLKRKTSKDSSSSSSKDEQILISSLTRDKLLRRKSSLEQEAVAGVRPHTAIQRVKRAEIVAAVTERLYSSRKQTEESNNMAANNNHSNSNNNASGTRSPPEGTDVKIPTSSSGFAARSKLQEISRKMLLKRRRINVETQTEAASTLRLKDTASLTDEPKMVLQDAAVLTDEHTDCEGSASATDHRLPVLRVKDIATLTDQPRTRIYRCKDAESLANDLDFDDYELRRSPRDGILSNGTQNYVESNRSESAEVSESCPESDRKVPCADSSTNTFVPSAARHSAVQTVMRQETVVQRKDTGCGQCCNLAPANGPEKNVISISLPDMISITIESTNGLESRIAVMDDSVEEKPKPASSDKESQTEKQVKHEVEGSFLEDLSVRSTAIQADGRVFRIENIFQDPRSKSSSDAVFDLRRETAMKKSVTFRNSLGTSSIVETKESSTEMEWDRIYVPHPGQRKRSFLKGGLTRAFIAKRRSYSLSPRRSANRLVRHELWKNWTLPCPGESSSLVGYNKEMIDTLPFVLRDTGLTSINDPPSSTINNGCTSNGEMPEDTTRRYSFSQVASTCEDSKKLASTDPTKADYEYNFSDDSLDYEEDNVARKASDAKVAKASHETYENLCPPDVVAHTKKEASKPASHVDAINVQPSIDDDFEVTEVELPKRKPTDASDQNLIHDYKSLILGTFSYVIDSDPDKGIRTKTSGVSDSINKKKVSFSNPSSLEEIDDTVDDLKILAEPKQVVLKSIIKKIKKKKSGAAESLDVVQSNVEAGEASQRKKPTISEEISSAARENEDLEDSKGSSSDKKVEFSNEDSLEDLYSESDSLISEDEDTNYRAASRRNILEEYLNEAMTFMRNMNSINEYMSATNMLEKCRRKRRGRARRNLSASKDYVKSRRKPKDDTDKQQPADGDDDEVVPVESYERCLKGIERLEACIDKVSEHNRLLRDKYGIDVESTGAKSDLASPSVDSKRTFAVTEDNAVCQRDHSISKDDASSPPKIPSPSLTSNRADVAKRSGSNERGRQDKDDPNYEKNNDLTSRDDLERRIFDQLMDAADSSSYWSWSPRRPRQRRFWKMSDLRSRSPTTYSKFRETFCHDTRRVFDFHEAPEDYLGEIVSSPRDFGKTKLSGPTGDVGSTWTSTESEIDPVELGGRDKLPVENRGPLTEIKISNESTIFDTKPEHLDCLSNSASLVEARRMSREEDEIARRNTGSKDSLRIDSMNHKFGPLGVELKYPESPRAKFLELLKERRRIVENSRGTSAF